MVPKVFKLIQTTQPGILEQQGLLQGVLDCILLSSVPRAIRIQGLLAIAGLLFCLNSKV